MRKRKAKKAKVKTKSAYMTKRAILRAAVPAVRKAAEKTMQTMGYTVVYKNGWIVKIDKEGNEEKIKKVNQSKRSATVALD